MSERLASTGARARAFRKEALLVPFLRCSRSGDKGGIRTQL